MDAGLLSKVNLSPVPGAAQFPDSLPRRCADVLCHPSMIGLAFALYLAHTLFVVRKAETMYLFRKPSVLLLVVTALLPCGAAARAQQDADVTVIIKAKSKPTTPPTLLVLCDLVCDWKLDGEVKGQIEAGGSAKVKVEPGQHMVEATTEDGIDGVKQPSTVQPTGQTMVTIELQPVRDFRLIAQQELRDEGAQARAAKEQAERDLAVRQERERLERERIARDEAAGAWTDSATGLMWTKKDNGDENVTIEKQARQYDLTWQQAADYCRNLRQGGHSDWRLPTIEELHGIESSSGEGHPGHCCEMYHETLNEWRVKGNLQLTGEEWSSTPGPGSKDARYFGFFIMPRAESENRNVHTWKRALCVRPSEN